jgi:hypothetical protein
MDYRATEADDNIDQSSLNLPAWPNIFALTGNDTITFGNANVVGGAGNDKLVGLSQYSGAAYWDSPAGVNVNLATGIASDGFGGTDTLVNIHNVHGSGFNDAFIGSSGNDTFYGSWGNDTAVGGGGQDLYTYVDAKSTEAKVNYDAASDTFTVVKNFANGDQGTDVLTGVSVMFTGDAGGPAVFSKQQYVPKDGFLLSRSSFSFNLPNGSLATQVKHGDFNGDGHVDIYVATQAGTGTAPSPIFLLTGDGSGKFADTTSTTFPNAPRIVVGGGRTLTGDFNQDGMTDIFQLDFGDDAPPFAGGKNHLFLSSRTTKGVVDASASLVQNVDLNHAGSVADINGDGYLDVVSNALGGGNIQFLNDGTGHFTPGATIPLPNPKQTNTSSGLIDMNGDGLPDLILGTWDNEPNPSQILLNNGRGGFDGANPINLPRTKVSKEIIVDVKAIDLNSDGRPDLVMSVTNGGGSAQDYGITDYYTTAYIQVLINEGNNQYRDDTAARIPESANLSFGKGWLQNLQIVDINLDGAADIVVTGSGIRSFLLMNDGKGVLSKTWVAAQEGHVIAADVDADGYDDLVTINPTGSTVEINANRVGIVYKAAVGGESLRGSTGNDKFISSAGADAFDGAQGTDTVVYAGKGAGFRITSAAGKFNIQETGTAGVIDTVTAVERVQFDDSLYALYQGKLSSYKVVKSASGAVSVTATAQGSVDVIEGVDRVMFEDAVVRFDILGIGGQAYRVYQAAFARTPDAGGLGYWISAMDGGVSLKSVAQGFVDSVEFKNLYGTNPSNAEIVAKFYQNVLQRPGEKAGIDYWAGVLDAKTGTVADILMGFSESAENQAALIGVVSNRITYTPYG